MNIASKKLLLTGTALVAATFIYAGAASAATELANPTNPTITVSDFTGLIETTGSTAVTLDSGPAGAIILGANGTPSVVMNSVGNTLTLNVTTSGATQYVNFADNVTATAGNIIINNTNDTILFNGNVSTNVAINAGNGSSNGVANVTINTINPENITFEGTINAVDAANNVSIGLYNNHGGINSITITGAIGGNTDATRIDAIQIGAKSTATMDVKFQNSVNASGAITLGMDGGEINTNNVYFGNVGQETNYSGTIQGAEVVDTNNVIVVSGSTVTFNNAFGNNIDNIAIGGVGTTKATFNAGIPTIQGALTLAGAAGVTNEITFNATSASFSVNPTVQGIDANATNNIIVSGNGNTVTMVGGATNIDSYKINAGSTLKYQSSIINNVSGPGNLTLASVNAQSAGTIGATGAGNSLSTFRMEGAGAKTLTTAIFADTTEIDATTVNASASFNGNIKFTSTGVLNLADNAGATGPGNITTSANNQGTINFAGNTAIDGAVGASGAALAALNINSNAGQKVDIGGALHTASVKFTSAGTLNLKAAAGGSVIGTIEKTGANESILNADNTSGTTTIGTISVAANGSLDVNGANVAVTGASTLGSGSTLKFAGSSLGSVSGAGSTLTLDGAAQSVGQIGASGNKLTAVNLINGDTKTFNANVYAVEVDMGSSNVVMNGTLLDSGVKFKGDTKLQFTSANSRINGNIESSAPGQGSVVYTGGLQIIGDVARLKTFDVTDTVTINGNMTAADNMNVGINNMTLTGTFTTTATTQLTYRVNTPTTSGKIKADGEATVVAGTKVNMIVDTNVYVAQGQEFLLIDGKDSGGHVETLTAGNLTTTNTALLHFKQKITDKNNLIVYADRTQMNTVATVPNNAALGAMLDKMGGTTDPQVNAFQVALGKADTNQQVEDLLATAVPNVSGATTTSVISVGASTGNILNTRVASLRAGESYGSGMAAGNGDEGGHFWGQVFGSSADQDTRQRIKGYQADTYGTVWGFDTEFWDDIRTGVALAYANTDVDGRDANRSQTDIDSYQLSLYGDYDLPDSYYLTGQISYMYSDIDTTRYNVGAVVGQNAHANFNSNQYSIRTEVGRAYKVDGTRFSLTPAGTFNYTYVDMEDYTEHGAGGMSLRNVDSDDMNILEFGGKLKAEAKFEDHAGGYIAPNLHAGYAYDVIGDKVATSANLAGGGTAFKTQGFKPSQHAVSAGAGVTWKTASDFEMNLNYDYEHKSDYEAHSGYIRAGYKF